MTLKIKILLILSCLFLSDSSRATKNKLNEKCTLAKPFKLRNIDGDFVTLERILKSNKKVTMLSFFQKECPPCHTEAKYLTSISKKIGNEKIQIVFIGEKESRERILSFIYKNQILNHLILADPYGALEKDYDVKKLPLLLALDSKGRILKKWKGVKEESVMYSEIKELTNGQIKCQ